EEHLQIEMRKREVEAQLDAANLAHKRLANFLPIRGANFQYPRCWIDHGTVSDWHEQPNNITTCRVVRCINPRDPRIPTMHRLIGFLQDATAAGSEFMVNGLRKGLAEAGFVEGRNLTIEYAWTDGRSERLPALAAELVSRHVPVIVSSALNATYAAT